MMHIDDARIIFLSRARSVASLIQFLDGAGKDHVVCYSPGTGKGELGRRFSAAFSGVHCN